MENIRELLLHSDGITLVQAVKKAGIGSTGGQSKYLIREGHIQLNGQIHTSPNTTLKVGDKFGSKDGETWVVTL
ncbi:MAG: hypothetical protein RIR17_711 [Planctomycetota bacterium]|jgi:ribosome-associated protein